MIVIYCSDFCPSLFLYGIGSTALQFESGGTTKKRGFKPLFFVLCSFILRCRADDIRRLVGLVYDGLCASPHHHSRSQSLRLRSTSGNNNEVVCCPRIAHIMLVEPIIENLLLGHSPCAIMYRLYCFAVQILGGTTAKRLTKVGRFFVLGWSG